MWRGPRRCHVVAHRVGALRSATVPTTAELQAHTLKRGEKIRLVDDIPSHSQGSTGKIAVANGITWKRYWVRFQDGSSVGHVNHHSLVRLKDYDTFVAQRDLEATGGRPPASAAVEPEVG